MGGVKISEPIILSVVLYQYESWPLTQTEEYKLKVLENRVRRKMFGPSRKEAAVG
jgi:hypothetical protein